MTNTTKKKFIPIIILLVCVLIGGLVYAASRPKVTMTENEGEVSDYHTLVVDDKNYQFNTSIVSILLMGIDVHDDSKQGQADAMQVLLLDRQNKKINLVAIPRDTMCEIRMFDVSGNDLGWQRQHLNLAYFYGSNPKSGCMYTAQAVSRLLLEVPINYYASLNLNKLADLHDVVGPLEVVVPNNSLVDKNPNWKKGKTITLESKDVELYLRSRDIEIDFSNEPRMERQKSYMMAYYRQLKENLETDFDNTLAKLYNICKVATTNITYNDIVTFANMVLEYEFLEEENYYVLEGEHQLGDYHDEFEVDKVALKNLVKQLFYKEEEQ